SHPFRSGFPGPHATIPIVDRITRGATPPTAIAGRRSNAPTGTDAGPIPPHGTGRLLPAPPSHHRRRGS
ncbi:MAG: hypothetical protein KGH73_12795, partial [Xanthomonadaceae bacterium]|nr:hypothetical protein [Xanthomonadaceae bacterium]